MFSPHCQSQVCFNEFQVAGAHSTDATVAEIVRKFFRATGFVFNKWCRVGNGEKPLLENALTVLEAAALNLELMSLLQIRCIQNSPEASLCA